MPLHRNPEFLRHLRSELRPARAITVLAVVLVICILVWLGCWGSEQQQIASNHWRAQNFQLSPEKLAQLDSQAPVDLWHDFYRILIYSQLVVLTFWSLLCCAQSISGERERKTWDFQRATSLSPAEFLIGKLLGEPIVAWFIVLCCLPITAIAAWLGHVNAADVLGTYVLTVAAALFIGIVGLWLSNLFEARSRGIGLLATVAIYLIVGSFARWSASSFPGLAAFSPVVKMSFVIGSDPPQFPATILGDKVPWLAMSLILYSTFGAWFVLMILRGLKKDFDQIKLLSRWQAVGCAAFLNLILYALFRPVVWTANFEIIGKTTPTNFVSMMVWFNALILFAMGLAMISPYDHLKVWWRERSGFYSLLAEDSPPLPWLVVSAAIAYVFLIWGYLAWKHKIGFDANALLAGLLQSMTILIFVSRDILFLQWCRLTRMRAPILKGVLYLALYYTAAAVLSSAVKEASHYTRGRTILALLTPLTSFDIVPGNIAMLPEVVTGLVIQLGAIVFLLTATARKLNRAVATQPKSSPAAA